MDEELGRFKTGVNLSEFAASRGYVLDRRESSRNSAVMRHPNGDKIVIARHDGGVWMYFSVRDDRDNGTIVDFVQRRDGGSLGKVRKILRTWLGAPRPEEVQLPMFAQDLLPVSKDRAAVMAVWERAKVCVSLPYLASRGIGTDVLVLPRFKDCVRVDQRNNAIFPHYDKAGLCGYEIKNKEFTGFAPGGVKGLWFSKAQASDRRLVLVESAIDAYSFHILHGDPFTRYMSTGGELNPQQPALLRGAMEKLPAESVVLLAFDNDEGGEKITEEAKAVAPAGRDIRRVLPETGKDWNDDLKRKLGLT